MSIKGATILIPSKIQAMLKNYSDDLEEAWTNAGEDPLTISAPGIEPVTLGKKEAEPPDLDIDHPFYNGKKNEPRAA